MCTEGGWGELGSGDTLRSQFLGKSRAAGSQLVGEHRPASSFSRALQEHQACHPVPPVNFCQVLQLLICFLITLSPERA